MVVAAKCLHGLHKYRKEEEEVTLHWAATVEAVDLFISRYYHDRLLTSYTILSRRSSKKRTVYKYCFKIFLLCLNVADGLPTYIFT